MQLIFYKISKQSSHMVVQCNNSCKSSIRVKHAQHTMSVHYSIRYPNWFLHYFESEFIQIFMTATYCYSWNDMLKHIGLCANYNNRYEINKKWFIKT